jgi:hypothetical protein
MTALDEERLYELRRLVPPVLAPPINEVHERATRLRRTRNAYRLTGAIALVCVVVVALAVGGRNLSGRGTPTNAASGTGSGSAPALSCATAVQTSPLPEWARGGFTPPDQAIAHMTGSRGDIVGVLFGTLHAPPLPDQGNKILWVAHVAGGSGDPDLKIHATLNGTNVAVDRVVSGGPGPSTIDVPQPGCWTFTLSWSGYQERLAVPFS